MNRDTQFPQAGTDREGRHRHTERENRMNVQDMRQLHTDDESGDTDLTAPVGSLSLFIFGC